MWNVNCIKFNYIERHELLSEATTKNPASLWSQRALLSHQIGTSRANSNRARVKVAFVNYVISDAVGKLNDHLLLRYT